MKTKEQRQQFMSEKIGTALRGLKDSPKHEWGPDVIAFGPFEEVPDNPKADVAERLCAKIGEYVEGKADESAVRNLYKDYVGLYAR